MSYTKQNWQSGDTITATKLNHMEDGIADGGGVLFINIAEEGDSLVMDKTWQQIHDAPFAVVPYEYEGTLVMSAIVSVSDNPYSVTMQALLTGDGGTLPPKETFSANSANDYPTQQDI